MRYTSETHNLLDTALELTGQPVQLRITSPEGASEFVVGALSSAYHKSPEVSRVRVGGLSMQVNAADQWEIFTREQPESENAEPESAEPERRSLFIDHPEQRIRERAIDHNERDGDGYPTIHALRWENGVATGYHLAAVTGRLSMDALKVRFVLDGKESGALYSGIRATEQEWETLRLYANPAAQVAATRIHQ